MTNSSRRILAIAIPIAILFATAAISGQATNSSWSDFEETGGYFAGAIILIALVEIWVIRQ
jgi:predicted ribosomally synthesized peptide with SipW-like signal peptide